MIQLKYTGLCESCESADLKLECVEGFSYNGKFKQWSVKCIHKDACNEMEDKVIKRMVKEEYANKK